MKKKLGWIMMAAALVVLIGGASVLYNKYSGEVENERLMTEDSTQAVIEESEPAEEVTEEETAEETEEEPEKIAAPDFTVYDQDGNTQLSL